MNELEDKLKAAVLAAALTEEKMVASDRSGAAKADADAAPAGFMGALDGSNKSLSGHVAPAMRRGNAPVKVLRWAAPAIAAAAAALILLIPARPEDTFKDPMLAYAEVEKAFSLMSEKIERGSEIASKAEEPIEMINAVFK